MSISVTIVTCLIIVPNAASEIVDSTVGCSIAIFSPTLFVFASLATAFYAWEVAMGNVPLIVSWSTVITCMSLAMLAIISLSGFITTFTYFISLSLENVFITTHKHWIIAVTFSLVILSLTIRSISATGALPYLVSTLCYQSIVWRSAESYIRRSPGFHPGAAFKV